MVFEPISGTIGAVALVDPALRGFSWMYGKYKLLEHFSDHYISETIKYRSEVARFLYVRDLKIDAFGNRLLNESETFFVAAFRDRLILAIEALEECEELVAKHDPSHWRREKEEPEHHGANFDSALSGFQPENEATVNNKPPPVELTESAVSSQSADTSENTEPSTANSTLSTSSSGFGRFKDKSFFLRSRLPFRKGKRENKHDVPRSEAAQRLELASTDLRKRQKAIEQSRIEQQKETQLAERLRWVAEERSRFMYLNKEIRKHNDYFLSFVGPQENQKNREVSSKTMNTAVLARRRHIASHIQRLIRALGDMKLSNRVHFQMMLLESPFELRSRMGDALPTDALLRPSSSMFPFKILKNAAQATNESRKSIQANASVIFEVPSPKQTSEDLKQQVEARHKIESFAENFPPARDPNHEDRNDDENRWWSVIGNINDVTSSGPANESSEPISVFLDRASYLEAESLQASFNDPAFANLATTTHLIYRLRLAYILASSFTSFLLADCPVEYIIPNPLYTIPKKSPTVRTPTV